MSTHTSTDKGAEAERTAFQSAFLEQFPYLNVNTVLQRAADGQYILNLTEVGWQMWRAARRAPAPVADGLPPLPAQLEELRARWKCEDCDGRGHDGEAHWQGHFQPPEPAICGTCKGAGWVECEALLPEQATEYALAAIAADRQARASVPAAGAVQQPVAVGEHFAWAAFADNGNVIIWSRLRSEVEPVAAKYGKPVVPVVALHVDGAAPAPGNTAQPVEQVSEQPPE